MQDAQLPRGEVVERAADRAQLVADVVRESHRDGVDGEVAPREVLVDARRAHLGQRAGARIRLGARAHDVDPPAVRRPHRRRAEPAVLLDDLAQRARHRRDLALDGQIDVAHLRAELHVADRAADQPKPRKSIGNLKHGRAGRQP